MCMVVHTHNKVQSKEVIRTYMKEEKEFEVRGRVNCGKLTRSCERGPMDKNKLIIEVYISTRVWCNSYLQRDFQTDEQETKSFVPNISPSSSLHILTLHCNQLKITLLPKWCFEAAVERSKCV